MKRNINQVLVSAAFTTAIWLAGVAAPASPALTAPSTPTLTAPSTPARAVAAPNSPAQVPVPVDEKAPNPADFPPLLATGVDAPDFVIEDKDGKPVHLSDFRGKVVVLEFWETFCKVCQRAMPHANDVVRPYKDKDVVLLGVDFLESRKTFKKWVGQHKELDAFTFGVDTTKDDSKNIAVYLYKVSITPTTYVIGKDGKIVASLFGYPGPNDDLLNALKKAGVSEPAAP